MKESKDCPFDCSVKKEVHEMHEILTGARAVWTFVKYLGGTAAGIVGMLYGLHAIGIF